MTEGKEKSREPGLFQTLSSLQFGLVVLISMVVVAIVGTVLPQGRPPSFYAEHYNPIVNLLISIFRFDDTYRSPLFLGLSALFGINLVLCSIVAFPSLVRRAFRPDMEPSAGRLGAMQVSASVEAPADTVAEGFRKAGFPVERFMDGRWYGSKGVAGYFGAYVVHLSLLLFLVGGLVSLLSGFRGYVRLVEGESTDTAILSETHSMPLGFEIRLDAFQVEFYEQFPGRPKSYVSSVTVTREDGASFEKDIRVNSPLMIGDLTVYQSSYGVEETGDTAAALDDSARIEVRLKGSPETMPPVVTLDMVTGRDYVVPGFGDSITVSLAELKRDFKVSGGMGSGSNPAALVDVAVNGQTRWSVYAFLNFPGLNMPMYDDLLFTFTMTDYIRSERAPEDGAEERYYTVLGVVSDKGIPVIWIAAALMTIGLFLSFFVRPRRLWLLEQDGKVHVGGTVKGDPEPFRRFVRSALDEIRRKTN